MQNEFPGRPELGDRLPVEGLSEQSELERYPDHLYRVDPDCSARPCGCSGAVAAARSPWLTYKGLVRALRSKAVDRSYGLS